MNIINKIFTRKNNFDELSEESKKMLLEGIESGRTKPPVYLGSFLQYIDDEDNNVISKSK